MNPFEDWYFNNKVQWEILKSVRDHELNFVGKKATVRYQKVLNLEYLKKKLRRFFLGNDPHWHFFRSIQYLELFPDGDKTLEDDWDSLVTGYDFVMDIDAPDIQDAKEQTIEVREYLKSKMCPFYILFSGNKGFHVRIPWEDLGPYLDPGDYSVVKSFGDFVIEKSGVDPDFVDESIWMPGRPSLRVAYSLHPESHLVCFPLTTGQLYKFHKDMASPYHIVNNIDLYRRGKLKKGGDFRFIHEAFEKWQSETSSGSLGTMLE